MIIAFNGFARSGKDTAAKVLIDNFGFTKISFAEPLRRGLYDMNPIVTCAFVENPLDRDGARVLDFVRLQSIVDDLGWEDAKVKYPEIRNLMQKYGTEAGRDIFGQDCWLDIALKQVKAEPNRRWVITDLRFANEKKAIEELGGYVARITREGVNSVNSHISDALLDGIDDEIYNNSTIDSLEYKVTKYFYSCKEHYLRNKFKDVTVEI